MMRGINAAVGINPTVENQSVEESRPVGYTRGRNLTCNSIFWGEVRIL